MKTYTKLLNMRTNEQQLAEYKKRVAEVAKEKNIKDYSLSQHIRLLLENDIRNGNRLTT